MIPSELNNLLNEYQQTHLLFGFENLSHEEQHNFANELKKVDFAGLQKLYAKRDEVAATIDTSTIQPIEMESPKNLAYATKDLGETALRNGEVAVLLVAGGQGSRLGFEKPKGMFPIGPASNKTLFQIHAEKVLALGKKYGKSLPFLIMTSPATHDDTVKYFESVNYFGLNHAEVRFFQQGTMPALDLATGQVLLEAPGKLFLSPNGHGGTLTALATSGLLQEMANRGIRDFFYFQVDNPLVTIADPWFLGRHRELDSEVSSRAIAKAFAEEKMGVLANIAGRCGIVEYSDMPKELQQERDSAGNLVHRAGSPAIHLFSLSFLQRLIGKQDGLPFHLAKKKVACLDANGKRIEPQKENALKFEMFIFDALPQADRWLVLEAERASEFAPVKNATGLDSPETSKQALSNLAATWIESVGGKVTRNEKGDVPFALEISPLVALEAADLAGKLDTNQAIESTRYFE
jgi:UDP-N-acetylglucosamine/UDP-N-acetylgalactosamine diphosphorylase